MTAFQRESFDLIVVGTGPGGATVAREMSLAGKRVLMLERGPYAPVTGSLYNYVSQLLIPGRSLLFTNSMLSMVRGLTTGGSSIFYYGTAFEPPLSMFSKHGMDIASDLQKAKNDLPIGPLKDEMMTPVSNRIAEAAVNSGFDWKRLNKFMYQNRWLPEFPFGYAGDSFGVKWSARMYVEDALQNGALIVDRAKVENVMVEDGRAVGVRFKRKGERHEVRAEKVVLAAGGIGTPVILRRTGIKEAGYNFFFDPLITVCGTMQDVKTQPNEIPMSAGIHMEDEGYLLTDMPVSPLTHMAFAAQVFRFTKLFSYKSTARIMVKAKDTLGGKLTDSGGVRKTLIEKDRRKLLHGFENAKKILTAAGAKDIYKTWYFAAHPGGTAKIGEIVDADLKTRIDDLHVCDCSVIPEAWGLPPTLALVTLGNYLARRLSGEKARRGPVEPPAAEPVVGS